MTLNPRDLALFEMESTEQGREALAVARINYHAYLAERHVAGRTSLAQRMTRIRLHNGTVPHVWRDAS